MPFSRTYADTFAKRVWKAAAAYKENGKGNGDTVSVEELRKVFTTDAWFDLSDPTSRISKLINSDVFKNKKGEIVANHLVLFGFINCPGDVAHKSEALYGVF